MLDERGREIPDPKPMVHPLGIQVQETLAEKIKRMVRFELSRAASEQGHESFEDADDFDVGDDDELRSPYELFDRNFEDDVGGQSEAAKSQTELRAGSEAGSTKPPDAAASSGSQPGATGGNRGSDAAAGSPA